jgi:hypothetical protein
MKRKGESDILWDQVVYLILGALFVIAVGSFIYMQTNSAGVWGEFYLKRVIVTLNSAHPGDEVVIEVHKATEIAKKNGITNFDSIFNFNNAEKLVCVQLSTSGKFCMNYFNEIYVEEPKIDLGISSEGKNLLKFRVVGAKL